MIRDILDTIASWTGNKKSRYQAKNRLQLVIAHDRAGVNPEIVDKMRQEILEVVSRYMDIDVSETEFFITSNDRVTALTANLPIKKVKRTRNIANVTDK
jgi:cell division topological specificity factor